MANPRPSMGWIVVGTRSQRRIYKLVGYKVNPALDGLAVFVFIPHHKEYDKQLAQSFKLWLEKIRQAAECIPKTPA